MNPWLRRILYLLVLIIWFVIMTFPFFAVFLASRGEIQLGHDTQQHVRIFLIQERNAEGIGIERVRPLPDTQTCTQTHVQYIMWAGKGENVIYCQCADTSTETTLPIDTAICPKP